MAGIYVHIPFCHKACVYCNFHFSTSLKRKNDFLRALFQEIDLQHDYLKNKVINTIYFGGGTPSVLSGEEVQQIVDKISSIYNLHPKAEITLEANPEDLSASYLSLLSESRINRLSIGVQSFVDAELEYLGRTHSGARAEESILHARQAGFENITIDLIFGIPGQSVHSWTNTLKKMIALAIPHASCYALTVEARTILAHQIKKGRMAPSESKSARLFAVTMAQLEEAGYQHYEISNFARPGFESKHNMSYWQGSHYLGLGPSAHSFNGVSRQWNVANNTIYIRGLAEGKLIFEREKLSTIDRFHDYLLTRIRTSVGIKHSTIITVFGQQFSTHIRKVAKPFIKSGLLVELEDEDTLILSNKGKLMADHITRDMFLE